TLRTQSSLGAAYFADRQLDRSVPLIEDTLRKQEKLLGPENRDTLSTAENLLYNYEAAKKDDLLFGLEIVWLPRLMKAYGPGYRTTGRFVPGFLASAQQRKRMADAIPVQEMLYAAAAQQ